MSARGKGRVSTSEVSDFCEQLALVLHSKLPVHEAIDVVCQEMDGQGEKSRYKELGIRMKETKSLAYALQKSGAFPEYMVHMVRIGETTGKLKEVMSSLATYYECENRLKVSIKNMVCYPVLVFFMMGLLLCALVTKVLPLFQKVFYELGTEVPDSSRIQMTVSMMLGRGMAVFVVMLFVLLFSVLIMNRTKKGRRLLRRIANYMPYIGRTMYQLALYQFISSLSILSNSGYSSEQALQLTMELSRHPEVRKKIFQCTKEIRSHKALEEALRDSGLISGSYGSMLTAGAKTGQRETVLEQLTQKQEKDVEQMLSRVFSVVEIAAVIVLLIMVGVVLLSVLLPLISIMSAIG